MLAYYSHYWFVTGYGLLADVGVNIGLPLLATVISVLFYGEHPSEYVAEYKGTARSVDVDLLNVHDALVAKVAAGGALLPRTELAQAAAELEKGHDPKLGFTLSKAEKEALLKYHRAG